MESFPELKYVTSEAKRFIGSFKGRLEELVNTNNLPPGMAITLMANLSFHGQDMPASVFNRLDYNAGFETTDDPIVLGEAFKKIDDGKVKIDRTIRADIGDFKLQYNFMRGYRPKREARKIDVPLDLPFNPNKFNYGVKECDPELFHSVKHNNNLTVDFLFNRYPFAPYHFLWIPNRKTGRHNEYLNPEKDSDIIEAMWDFVTNQGFGEGIRLCYNSNGAHASVNHLHLQGFFVTDDWEPPFEAIIRDNVKIDNDIRYVQTPRGEMVGVKKAYPQVVVPSGIVNCYFPGTRWISDLDGVNGLKEFIKEMNNRYANGEKIAYNFCLTSQGIACFPRKHQGDKKYFELLQKAPFTTGYAFFEMLGEIISPTTNISIFDRDKTERQIRDLYEALSI